MPNDPSNSSTKKARCTSSARTYPRQNRRKRKTPTAGPECNLSRAHRWGGCCSPRLSLSICHCSGKLLRRQIRTAARTEAGKAGGARRTAAEGRAMSTAAEERSSRRTPDRFVADLSLGRMMRTAGNCRESPWCRTARLRRTLPQPGGAFACRLRRRATGPKALELGPRRRRLARRRCSRAEARANISSFDRCERRFGKSSFSRGSRGGYPLAAYSF